MTLEPSPPTLPSPPRGPASRSRCTVEPSAPREEPPALEQFAVRVGAEGAVEASSGSSAPPHLKALTPEAAREIFGPVLRAATKVKEKSSTVDDDLPEGTLSQDGGGGP